jgi:hypothetical protein
MLSAYFRAPVCGAALGVIVAIAPAMAATVTDFVTFTDVGTFPVNNPDPHGYQGAATAAGSFNITFDPTVQILPSQLITGVITNLVVTVTDPYFNPPTLSFNPILYYAFDGAGTLTLSSDPALSKALVDVPFITIGINGWAYGDASSVWYSQDQYGNTLTTSGSATITELAGQGTQGETPLPAALPLFATGLGALGLLGWRRKKKTASLAA